MTTERAFNEIINRRDCHRKTGLSYSEISKYRKSSFEVGNFGNYGRRPTLDKMIEILKKYGAIKIKEEIWTI